MNITKEKSYKLIALLLKAFFNERGNQLLEQKISMQDRIYRYFSNLHVNFAASVPDNLKPWFEIQSSDSYYGFHDNLLCFDHNDNPVQIESIHSYNLNLGATRELKFEDYPYLVHKNRERIRTELCCKDQSLLNDVQELNDEIKLFNGESSKKRFELEAHFEMFSTVKQLETVIPTIRAVIPEWWVLEHERKQEEQRARREERAKERLIAQQLAAARAAQEKKESGIDISSDDAAILTSKFMESF